MAASLEGVRVLLSKLAEQVEDISIEAESLRNMLISEHNVNPGEIDMAVDRAKHNPEIRKRIHQNFSAMWAALVDHAIDELFQELTERYPPRGKPN